MPLKRELRSHGGKRRSERRATEGDAALNLCAHSQLHNRAAFGRAEGRTLGEPGDVER